MNVAQYFLGKNGTSSGTNIRKNILPTTTGYNGMTYSGISNNASSKVWDYLKQSMAYLFGIAIIIFIIMLFIHFFINISPTSSFHIHSISK